VMYENVDVMYENVYGLKLVLKWFYNCDDYTI
jgi:hypothetical protein